jgi:iron(III) transport system permease protein
MWIARTAGHPAAAQGFSIPRLVRWRELALLLALVLLIAAPLLAVFRYLPDSGDGLIRHLAQTVLADYLRNTLLLALGVAGLTTLTGAGTAWLVTMYRFPGQRVFRWALVLPLAMPAYVLAYTYTDFLQVTGPFQTSLRELTGWGVRDYWFPEIRSLGGAVFVLSAVLYPYVYVLARAAFLEQSQCALEVSRTLGCTSLMAFCRVGLPLARPAIATGVAFAVMEALADFGAVSFFGLPTFTTGIYRAWYGLGSPSAAAQLASLLLLFVFAVLTLERLSRGRARFANNTTHIFRKQASELRGGAGWLAATACAAPLALGFIVPALVLSGMALDADHMLEAARLWEITRNTLALGAIAALVIVGVAMAALFAVSRDGSPAATSLVRVATLGYAAPGAVIGVGIVVTLGWIDGAVDSWARQLLGVSTGLLLGGTVTALIYGYLTRFFAVAFNPLESGFAKIGPSVTDAARVLGCTPGGLFGRIVLPLLRPSALSALLLVFVDVMKELPATLILRPFDFDTLAVEAYRLATTERLAEAALPSFLIVLAGLLPVILLCRLLARGRMQDPAVC